MARLPRSNGHNLIIQLPPRALNKEPFWNGVCIGRQGKLWGVFWRGGGIWVSRCARIQIPWEGVLMSCLSSTYDTGVAIAYQKRSLFKPPDTTLVLKFLALPTHPLYTRRTPAIMTNVKRACCAVNMSGGLGNHVQLVSCRRSSLSLTSAATIILVMLWEAATALRT